MSLPRAKSTTPPATTEAEPLEDPPGIRAGKETAGLADYYRKVWSLGNAGVDVPLNVLRGTRVRDLVVHSADRYKYLRLNPSH